MPPAQDFFLHSQKAFINSRRITDHIKTLNHRFYSTRSHRIQHFLLFLDFEKAFDSVSHQYLFTILKAINMPQWFLSVVTSLFQNIKAFPSFDPLRRHAIKVTRGVKQGDPISPLFFNFALEPLLEYLDKHPGIDPFAFADDLAISFNNLGSFWLISLAISVFSSISGLNISQHKSILIPGLPLSDDDPEYIKSSYLPLIPVGNRTTYLGILFGPAMSTAEIYERPMSRFLDRLTSFSTVLRRMSVPKRILTINVFLLSMFSYVQALFLMPDELIQLVYKSLQSIIPFNAYRIKALTLPTNHFGLKQPLRDLKLQNISLLLSTPFPTGSPALPSHTHIKSPLISHHFLIANRIYHKSTQLRIPFCAPVDQLTPARTIYKKMSQERSFYKWSFPYVTKRLRSTLQAQTWMTPAHSTTLFANFKCLGPKFPSQIRYHQIAATFNALSFTHRIHHFAPVDKLPCPFCSGLDTEDRLIHIFSQCERIHAIRSHIGRSQGISDLIHPFLSRDYTLSVFLLNSMAQRSVRAITLINFAIWKARENILAKGDSSSAQRFITTFFKQHKSLCKI